MKTGTKRVAAILEPELAKRLEIACDNNSQIPAYHAGRLPWVQKKLEEQFNISVSRESVRKWLAGESRPTAEKMRALASVLKVNEGWLAFGSRREQTPEEDRRQSVYSDSAVNLVAGLFGMNGINYAFPEKSDPNFGHVHFYAIISGRQNSVFVAVGDRVKDSIKFAVDPAFGSLLTIGLVKKSPLEFELYNIPAPVIQKLGKKGALSVEFAMQEGDGELSAKGVSIPSVTDFSTIQRTPLD